MSNQFADISRIDASGRLRPINSDRVATLAETLSAGERLPPIAAPARPSGWERISSRFSRLPADEQVRFFEAHFEAHADAIIPHATKRSSPSVQTGSRSLSVPFAVRPIPGRSRGRIDGRMTNRHLRRRKVTS